VATMRAGPAGAVTPVAAASVGASSITMT